MTKKTAIIPTAQQKEGTKALSLVFDADTDGWFLNGHADINDPPHFDIWHISREDALAQAQTDWGVSENAWQKSSAEDHKSARTLDANGTELTSGDNVTLIKDLDVQGANTTLKRGTTIKNIRLTDDPAEIDCPSAPIRGLVLKSCFVKKLV